MATVHPGSPLHLPNAHMKLPLQATRLDGSLTNSDGLAETPGADSTGLSKRESGRDVVGPLPNVGGMNGRRKRPAVAPTNGVEGSPTSSVREELGMGAKVFVFVLFTQLGQALMSYDGGATQMSTEPLLRNGWKSSELGLLGAMDKFGQVATAFVWSNLLMRYNIKLLLALGLFAKASSCLGFGVLETKPAMLGSKLGMGVSEALIGVWATVWVQANAPRESQARWLGFASISAGVGNGAGSAVAGLCAKRFGYAFAFVLQACILYALWGILLVTPSRWFEFAEAAAQAVLTPTPKADPEQNANMQEETSEQESVRIRRRLRRTESSDSGMFLRQELARSMSMDALTRLRGHPGHGSDHHHELLAPEPLKNSDSCDGVDGQNSFVDNLRIVLSSRLWIFTALSISLSCYISSAVAYLWQNTTKSVWKFSDSEATFSFLATTGLGGGVGVTFGPKLFDEYLKGFSDPSGRRKCLTWCTRLTGVAVLAGTFAALLFLQTAWHLVYYDAARQARGWVLAFVLAGVFCVFALVNAMQGTLYGINTDSTTPDTKTSAAALTVSMQNIVGFAMGPLIPSILAEMVGNAISSKWPETDIGTANSAQFSTGMAASLLALWPLLLVVFLAAASVDGASDSSDSDGSKSETELLSVPAGEQGGWGNPSVFIRADVPPMDFNPL